MFPPGIFGIASSFIDENNRNNKPIFIFLDLWMQYFPLTKTCWITLHPWSTISTALQLCLSHTYLYIQSRQEDRGGKKIYTRRQGKASTRHLDMSISQWRISSGKSLSTSYKRNIKGWSCNTPCVCMWACACTHACAACETLCSSYITLFCVGLPTSRLAACLEGTNERREPHFTALSSPGSRWPN